MTTEQNVTPAEELRAAASKIREAVGVGIHDTPWRADGVEIMGEFTFVAEIRHLNREEAGMAAQYFAMWHPGVVELIAEWFEIEAHAVESSLAAFPDIDAEKLVRWPLRIARAINGGAR